MSGTPGRRATLLLPRDSVDYEGVEGAVSLDAVETAVLLELVPPLNIDKVTTPWRPMVRAARKRLADQARAYASA